MTTELAQLAQARRSSPGPGRLTIPFLRGQGARPVLLAVAVAMASGATVPLGLPALGLGVAALVLLSSLIPEVQRLGRLLVVTGFAILVGVSDSAIGPSGVSADGFQFSIVKWLPYGLLLVGSAILSLPDSRSRARLRIPHVAVVGWAFVCGLAALANSNPQLSLLRWVQVVVPLVAALTVWRVRGPTRSLIHAVLAGAAWLTLSALAMLFGRGLGPQASADSDVAESGFRLGGFVHPGALGLSAALLGLYAIWLIISARRFGIFVGAGIFAVAGLALALSRARTAFLVAATMVAVVAILTAHPKGLPRVRRVDPRVFPLIVVALTLLVGASALAAWFVRGDASQLTTLTGRTYVWSEIAKLIEDRPLLGWGPGVLRSGAVAEEVEERLGFPVRHAHNSLLDAALAGGIPGGALWAVSFLTGGRLAFGNRKTAESAVGLICALWAGLLVWSAVESVAGFGLPWLLFLALLAALPVQGGTEFSDDDRITSLRSFKR